MQIIEAALFASTQPLTLDQLKTLFGEDEPLSGAEIREIVEALQALNDQRGIELVKVAGGYRYQSKRGLHPWISRLWDEKPKKYSRALMETLALIAYRQPITRGEIEDVRGVSVASNIIRTLLEREWVKVLGHRDVPGRPAIFGTTQGFLDYFGLNSLDELPPLDEIKSMAELEPELDLETGIEEGETKSFASMLNRLQEEDSDAADTSLEEELSEQWETLDELNDQFETGLRRKDQPEDDTDAGEQEAPVTEQEDTTDSTHEAAMTESEQLTVIQQKLAEQANLLEQTKQDDEKKDDPETD